VFCQQQKVEEVNEGEMLMEAVKSMYTEMLPTDISLVHLLSLLMVYRHIIYKLFTQSIHKYIWKSIGGG
jgi:hypothetical protein